MMTVSRKLFNALMMIWIRAHSSQRPNSIHQFHGTKWKFCFSIFQLKYNSRIHQPTEVQSKCLKRAKTTSMHILLCAVISKQPSLCQVRTLFFFFFQLCLLFVTNGICQVCPQKSKFIYLLLFIYELWMRARAHIYLNDEIKKGKFTEWTRAWTIDSK